MKKSELTEGQFETLKVVGYLADNSASKNPSFDLNEIVAASDKTKGSVKGFLGRLVNKKMLSERKGQYRFLKSGRVALLASEANQEMLTRLKQMRVEDIKELDSGSMAHLSGLFLQADSLPTVAVQRLMQAVEKHGAPIAEKATGIQPWSELGNDDYFKATETGKLEGNSKFIFQVKLSIQIDASKNGTFGSGRLLMTSVHPHSGMENEIFYYSAVNFSGKALEKTQALLNEKKGGIVMCNILAYGYVNILKPYQKTVNPTLHCHDFILLSE